MTNKIAIPVMMYLLCGCTSFGDNLLEASIPQPPQTWTTNQDQSNPIKDETPVLDSDWLAKFGDSQLTALVTEALENNNDFLAAAANLEAARQQSKIARAALLPTFSINADGSRNAIVTNPAVFAQTGGTDNSPIRANDLEDAFGVDRDGNGELDGLDLDGDGFAETPLPNRRSYINNYILGAQLSWELDLWGRLRNETNAARKEAYASAADLQAARFSIASAVAQNWYQLIESRLQRELAQRDVKAREQNYQVTKSRTDRGVSSKLDMRLSESALETSRANLAQRQQIEKETARRLEVLLGRYPAAELDGATQLPALDTLNNIGVPADVMVRRPDLLAAENRMRAAGLRATAARKQLLPTLTLSGRLNTSGPDLGDLVDPERLAGAIAGGLFQPVFQGGRIRANARGQRAQAEAAILAYAQTALRAYEEAENALAAEGFLNIQERAQKLAFERAQEAERLTEIRYVNGAATIFNRLDAQTRRISAESALISAQRQRVSNRIAVYVSIGGNFLTHHQDPALVIADHKNSLRPNPDSNNEEKYPVDIASHDISSFGLGTPKDGS